MGNRRRSMSRSRIPESRMLENPQVRFGGGQTKKEQQRHLVGWLPTFDHINHDALVKKLSTYPQLAQAIKAWLRAGALDGNVFVESPSGTPQGGVISPLLANIALHGMETAIIGAYPSGQQPHVERYPDDFVVLQSTEEGVRKAQGRAVPSAVSMGLEMKSSTP